MQSLANAPVLARDRLLPNDFFAIGATRRFRASQRRRLRESARNAMLLAVAAALLDCLWLIPIHPDAARLISAVNGGVAATAAIGFVALARSARPRPEIVVLGLLAAVDAAIVFIGLAHPGLGLVALVYLLLLPTIVALVVPWATGIHATWLGLHAATTVAFSIFASGTALPGTSPDGPIATIGFVVLSSAVSQLGHVTSLRARVLSYVQIERIKALNRAGRRDRERLDHLNAILAETARTDELTGLRNRLCLKIDLAVIRSRIGRRRERFGLVMLDLDRFKAINDRRGHIAGDEVLRAVAACLSRTVRSEDAVYRLGGEEFLVILKVADPTEAMAGTERLRRAVEELEEPHPDNPPSQHVTLSAGVAVIGFEDLTADDEAWIARADACLYRAKAKGRNRSESE